MKHLHLILLAVIAVSTTSSVVDAEHPEARVRRLSPGPGALYEIQAALIDAVPGDVIELSAGTYHLNSELNVVSDSITIRGAGSDETILSFKDQQAGSTGIFATGNGFVIEQLAVEDTVGNAIKVLGAKDVSFIDVRTEWTGGAKSTNGAYGIYPVECSNVLIDGCSAVAASDAGIYVGQCQDVIVRNCVARMNVAGIEIENTLRADVYDNVATNNAGGLLVFDLPGLNLTNGGDVRCFRNRVHDNNHPNFAPVGTMVAGIPRGTGVMISTTDRVEVFDNIIENHLTCNLCVVSFLITRRKMNDPKFDVYPETISIHHNTFGPGGSDPAGEIGQLVGDAFDHTFPDIFFDGFVNPKLVDEDGRLPHELSMYIADNGDITFANAHIQNYSEENWKSGRYKIDRDLSQYSVPLPPLQPVTLKLHQAPKSGGNPAVMVYRNAPRKLSEWGLLQQTEDGWQPADDLLPYDLNTALFSDYTAKHRLIRLPDGESMTWSSSGPLKFPVGTVIAKTFAYPDSAEDATVGERFMETRVEFKEESGWYGYSYLWNEDQSDADLKLGGGAVDISWTDAHGHQHSNTYQIPNANQCLSCHGQDGKYEPLGPTAGNLNRPHQDDHDAATQLVAWAGLGALEGAPADTAAHPKLVNFEDPAGSTAHRARAWLDVNCAHCHNPRGSARTSGLDLRVTQTDPAKIGVWKSPVATGKGSGGRRYDIVPGQPDKSILMYRLETDEPGARMPNLARNLIHAESNQLIHDWIAGLSEEQFGKQN